MSRLKTLCLAVLALALLAGPAEAIVMPGVPPEPLVNLTPDDGAWDVEMLPTFEWTGSALVVNYRLYVNDALLVQTAGTQWQVTMSEALPPDTDFTWYVRASFLDGHWEETEPTVFTTGSYPWITGISPVEAWPSGTVDIFGTNFGSEQGQVKLGGTFIDNDTWGRVLRWTDTCVTVKLPTPSSWGAALPGTFEVKVYDAHGVGSNVSALDVSYSGPGNGRGNGYGRGNGHGNGPPSVPPGRSR